MAHYPHLSSTAAHPLDWRLVLESPPLQKLFKRLVRQAIEAAHRAGRRVTVCGEMAADPEGGPALAALGVDALSVAVAQLGAVTRRLAECSAERLAELGPELAYVRTTVEVRERI